MAGAPRFNHTGKVILFTMHNNRSLTIHQALRGEQVIEGEAAAGAVCRKTEGKGIGLRVEGLLGLTFPLATGRPPDPQASSWNGHIPRPPGLKCQPKLSLTAPKQPWSRVTPPHQARPRPCQSQGKPKRILLSKSPTSCLVHLGDGFPAWVVKAPRNPEGTVTLLKLSLCCQKL